MVTFYEGERPYKLNQQINTRIKFVRNFQESLREGFCCTIYLFLTPAKKNILNKKLNSSRHYDQGFGPNCIDRHNASALRGAGDAFEFYW